MSPQDLDQYLLCLRANNVMSCNLKVAGMELTATFAPEFDRLPVDAPKAPGGWKTEPSDPADPDPLGLGALDAPIAFDDPEVNQ